MTPADWTDLGLMVAVLIALARFLRAGGREKRSADAASMTRAWEAAETRRSHPFREMVILAALVGGLLCAEASGLPRSLPAVVGVVGQALAEEQRPQAASVRSLPARSGWRGMVEDRRFSQRLLLLFFSVPLVQAGLAGLFLLFAPGNRNAAPALGLSLAPILIGVQWSALAALLAYLWVRNPFRPQLRGS